MIPSLPPSSPLPLDSWLVKVFRQLIVERTGLDVKAQDLAALCQIIVSRTQATKQLSPDNYYQLLMAQTPKSHQEWQHLIVKLTNPESFFFRDKGQLSVLRQCILPELIQRQQHEKKLRICSAGCSTGEEPYSIAILLKELIPNLAQWDLTIFGIDINPVSIKKAKSGIYELWSLRGVDAILQQTYFRQVNHQYHLDPQIKKLVRFQSLNLVDDPLVFNPGELANEALDLIICRNVFIYFDAAAIAKVVDKFYQALKPLGYFLAGHSELYGQDLKQFQVKSLPESFIFQRPLASSPSTPPPASTSPPALTPFTPPDLLVNAAISRETPSLHQAPGKTAKSANSLLQQAQISLKKRHLS